MTSILTITHILIFLNFPVDCHGTTTEPSARRQRIDMDKAEVEVEVEVAVVVDQEEDHQETSPTPTMAQQCSDDNDASGCENNNVKGW